MAEASHTVAPPLAPIPLHETAVLRARDLSVQSGRRTILRGVNLEVRPQEVLGLIGPSGAGKTTLLKSFNRLLELDPQLRVRGEVFLHGRPIDVQPPASSIAS
jgi:ABC-type phosphate transport system ATPase subunit